MKNVYQILICLLIASGSSFAQKIYTLVDIQHGYSNSEGKDFVTNLKYDKNGGTVDFYYTYPNQCTDSYKLSWDIKHDLSKIELDDEFQVDLKCRSWVRNCDYKWGNMSVLTSNNFFTSNIPSPPNDYEHGYAFDHATTSKNLKLYDMYAGQIASNKLKYARVSKNYTVFAIRVGNIGLSVYYICKLVDASEVDQNNGDVNCGALFGLAYNTGALHIRSGHNDPKTEVIQTIDNILVHVNASNCFDGTYLTDLRKRVVSSSGGTIQFLSEIEDFMHGIPEQVAEDCPCCTTCHSDDNEPDCEKPNTKDIYVTNIATKSAQLNTDLKDEAIEYRYRRMGSSSWIQKQTNYSYANITNLIPASSYEFQARIECQGSMTSWSNSKSFTTKSETVSCNTPSVDVIYVTGVTAESATLKTTLTSVDIDYRFRKVGSSTWLIKTPSANSTSMSINNLIEDATYEVQARLYCNGTFSGWSGSVYFWTLPKDSGCDSPKLEDIKIIEVQNDAIQLEVFMEVESYTWAFKELGETDWTIYEDKDWKSVLFYNLQSNTTYQFSVKVKCNGAWSEYCPVFNVTTLSASTARSSTHSNSVPDATKMTSSKEINASRSPFLSHQTKMNNIKNENSDTGLLEARIFPNPTSDYIKIEGNFDSIQGIILDMNGKNIQNLDRINNQDPIDVSYLKNGTYFLQMKSGAQIVTKQLVIVH